MITPLQTRKVFVFVLALGLFTMAARGVTDPDVWWHLRTGQLMLQNHALFHTDPYSFTRFGQPWINHEWLSEILIFGLYRVAGFGGLTIGFAVVIATTLLLVFRRCAGRPYLAAFMTLWGAVASAPAWGVRPQMLSLLLASIFLVLLEDSGSKIEEENLDKDAADKPVRSDQTSRGTPALLWWTAPLMLLWVNLHAGYPIGLAFLGLFLMGEAIEAFAAPGLWPGSVARRKKLALAFLICLVLVAVNPNGLRIYSYPLETLRSPAMHRFIQEWFSPDFHNPMYLPLLFMLLALFAGLAFSPWRPRLRDLVLLLATIPAALRSIRHIPILMLVLVPVLAGLAEGWMRQRGADRLLQAGRRQPSSRLVLANVLVLASFTAFALWRVHRVVSTQTETEAQHFPLQAVDFLRRERPPGPIMNHYNFGGYFIWKLYPEYRVFADGRADVYGDQFMEDFAASYYLRDSWNSPLKRWDVRTVVLPSDAPLITALRISPEWKQIYADSEAVILTLR